MSMDNHDRVTDSDSVGSIPGEKDQGRKVPSDYYLSYRRCTR